MDSLFWQSVIVQLLQVTLLIVVVGMASRLLRQRYPHIVYGLWCVVFIKCLTPPLIPSPVGVFAWQQPLFFADSLPVARQPARPVTRSEETLKRFSESAGIALASPDDCIETPPLSVVNPSPAETATSGTEALPSLPAAIGNGGTESGKARLLWLPLAFWLAGFLFVLGRGAFQWWALFCAIRLRRVPAGSELEEMHARLCETLCPGRKVLLVVTDRQFGPMVAGWRNPVVVFPQALLQRLSPGQIEMIVAHELVHVRRGDTLLCLLQYLTTAVWWFNPLVWWASRKTDELAERCCDLEVLGRLRCHPPAYVRSLLRVIEMRKQITLIAGAAGVSPSNITVERLKWLALQKGPAKSMGRCASFLTATVAALLVLPAAGFGMWQEHPRLNSIELLDVSIENEARRAYQAGDFETAARLFEKLATDAPDNGELWARFANSLQKLGRHEDSLAPFAKASALRHRGRSQTIMRWAGALSITGDTEAALKRIAEALDAGFQGNARLDDNELFVPLLENPEFLALSKRHDEGKQQVNRGPGLGLAQVDEPGSGVLVREIDAESLKRIAFLDGTWKVQDKEGNEIGSVEFKPDLKEQILNGLWKEGDKESATSRLHYDPRGQLWILQMTAGESKMNVAGELDETTGSLVFEGLITEPSGAANDLKWELSRESEEKLLIRRCFSTDDGETWSDWELRYLSR